MNYIYWLTPIVIQVSSSPKSYATTTVSPFEQSDNIWFIWGVIPTFRNMINDCFSVNHGRLLRESTGNIDHKYCNEWKQVVCSTNSYPPGHNGQHFTDDIFEHIFLNANVNISIQMSLKCVPRGPMDSKLTLVQVMAYLLYFGFWNIKASNIDRFSKVL